VFRKERRINPAINEGNNNTLRLQFGFEPLTRSPIVSQHRTRLLVSAEYSKPEFGSDFNYQKYSFLGNIRLNSFYSTLFNDPYFFISLAGGIVSGEYGIQHLPEPSTALSVYAPSGVLKGIQPYNLIGDKYCLVQLEHNWQTLPFALFHAKNLEEVSIQIITGCSIANTWNSSVYYEQQNKWQPYWEVYFGFANLLDLFRIDLVHTSTNANLIRMSISSMAFN
jgi:hypothetical protein